MNSAKTAIMVDSGCDISQEFIEQYDIKVLRLKVLYGDRMYSDGLDIDPLEVYRRFPQEIPTTSTPNMYEVSELVNEIKSEGYEKIIGITISSGLSGTYNAVAMAFEEEDIETFAFDTKNISCPFSPNVLIWVQHSDKKERKDGSHEIQRNELYPPGH